MHNQKGFMGCGNLVIIFWLVFMLAFGGFIILNKNIFHVPEEKIVSTSLVAARRCREKLEMFKENSYIKDIRLSELEVNSVLQDEFAHGQHKPIISLTAEMEPENLKLKCTLVFMDLLPQAIRTKLLSKSKQEREDNPPRKMVIRVDCQPVIEKGGNLFLNPSKLIIGKQKIPLFLVKIIKSDWFNYPVSEEISHIEIGEKELEIVKVED